MKLIANRVALNEALAACSTVIAARTPKPVLQCVRLSAADGALTLTAYDQEVGLRYRVSEVEIGKKGETLVSCERFSAIVRESIDETLSLEADEDVLHVRGSDSHFQIFGQNVREFPPVPALEGEADFTVRLGALRSLAEKTVFAAARENTRYAINGVLWELRGRKLQFVATDGRRLAQASASVEKASGDEATAIVPAKAMNVLGRLHLDVEETVQVKLTSNQAVLRCEQATLSSVLVEGRFPKYEDVIPKDFDKHVELRAPEFLSAVRRVALLTDMESKGIRLALSGEGMVLSSRSPQQGEAKVRLAVEYHGEALEIGFNPAFLTDALKVCEETVTLDLQTGAKPGVFKSKPDFLYVVMPVSLS